MKNLKFTPGPWTPNFKPKHEHIVIENELNEYICVLPLNKSSMLDKENANALLIAAAPEMLKALIDNDELFCNICVHFNPQHKNCKSCDDRDERIKIIEKATGLKIDEITGE